MSSSHDSYDVVVIGGGPGGSMCATLLADAGKRVLLLEAAQFPRYHIGESLLSGTADLLQRVGVLDRLENDGYIKKHGVEWIWGDNREPWTVYFKDALAMPYDYGYQVERGAFDKMLLDNAREHGVDARERHRVTDFARLDDGTMTVTFRDAENATTTVAARWIVDASGQGGTVTRRLHNQDWDPYLKNLAVWSYWRNAERPPGIDAGNTFLPTFDDGWWWFIPLRDDITSVGMVVDSQVVLENRDGGMEAYYNACLAKTPELAERLAGAERTDEIHVARDWSYIYDRFCGDGYIAVGDAACFIDPLFSTGVHLAMLSGFLAAATVNTVLDRPEIDRAKALEFYETEYRKEFARLRAQVYFLYGGHASTKDSYFWHARRQFQVPGIDPEKAFISLIAGAFQHRSWYRRYLERLEVPQRLRSTIEEIFDGKSTGLGVDPHQELTATSNCEIVEELAVDGHYLRPSRTIVSPGGAAVPLTDALATLLEVADGHNSITLVDRLVDQAGCDRDLAHSLVHEAVTYGLLAPKAPVASRES